MDYENLKWRKLRLDIGIFQKYKLNIFNEEEKYVWVVVFKSNLGVLLFISFTESDVNKRIEKAWTAIDSLTTV